MGTIKICVFNCIQVLLLVFEVSSVSSDTSTVTYKQCANVFQTPNSNLKGFAVAFNINLKACVEKCVDRPWCAAVMYANKISVCFVLFEEDLLEIDGASYGNQNKLTCVLIKKLKFPPELLEVIQSFCFCIFLFVFSFYFKLRITNVKNFFLLAHL